MERFETLDVGCQGRVGHLTLNRPAKRNALSVQVLEEVVAAAGWLDRRGDVRAVVVSGAGRHFSGGADLATFSESLSREDADAGRRAAEALEAMEPVAIAALEGWCVGGALVLAAACDLRLAAQDARFSIPEVDLGIPLAWGGVPRLVREIGPARTKELVMTCRPFGAAEALEAGFLNRVVAAGEAVAEARALAEALAAKPRLAIASTKRHVNAVTASALGTARSWSDADGLIGAMHDPECQAARERYLAGRG